MAVKGYGYDPRSKRSEQVADIASDLAIAGVPLDADTDRKMAKGRRGATTASPGRIAEALNRIRRPLDRIRPQPRLRWISLRTELFMSHPLNFPAAPFVRLRLIIAPLGPIPVGKSTWWAGVKSSRFPRPVKLGPRTTV